MQFFKLVLRKEKFAILIGIIFILGMLIGNISEKFRFDKKYGWIYDYGNIIAPILILGSVIWGIVNAVLILDKKDRKILLRLLWACVSLLPFLAIAISMLINILNF